MGGQKLARWVGVAWSLTWFFSPIKKSGVGAETVHPPSLVGEYCTTCVVWLHLPLSAQHCQLQEYHGGKDKHCDSHLLKCLSYILGLKTRSLPT